MLCHFDATPFLFLKTAIKGPWMSDFIIFSIDVFASIFIVALGLIVLTVIVFYFRDITQTKHDCVRNQTLPQPQRRHIRV